MCLQFKISLRIMVQLNIIYKVETIEFKTKNKNSKIMKPKNIMFQRESYAHDLSRMT